MLELTEYEFSPKRWPPPNDRKQDGQYLFGFDADNQPYVIKYEHKPGYQGWVAATLSENHSNKSTAVPRHILDDVVDKLIKYWADPPVFFRAFQ